MKTGRLSMFFASMLGAIMGCVLFAVILIISGAYNPAREVTDVMALSSTPGMDILDDHRCPKGQTKIILTYGIEDGFSRIGDEPAIIRPELLELALYKDLYEERSHFSTFRNFDERGVDAKLITYVDFPPNTVSGIFVSRLRFLSGSSTDGITFGDLVTSASQLTGENNFRLSISDIQKGLKGRLVGDLVILNFTDFTGSLNDIPPDLSAHLISKPEGVTLDLMVQDDTVVDFIGLSLCQTPVERKGTTLGVDSRELFGAEIISLSCGNDPNQSMCDPYAGDSFCRTDLPLGCYKEGNQPPPQNIAIPMKSYAGGDIRMTVPVKAERFNSLWDASAFCAKSFGPEWRVLSYHESGGSEIFANGRLPSKARMWVDVRDYPAANCWGNGPAREDINE